MSTEHNRRIVFARFLDDAILDEMGRLLYSILNIFLVNGYQVRLFDNIDFSKLDKYGQLVPSLNNLTLVDKIPDDSTHMLYLFDREDKSYAHHQWKKKVQVKFNIFAPYWITDPIFMPYPVHPLLADAGLPQRLEKLRKYKKRMRIFFSGDTEGYTKNRIHYPNTKLPRLEVIRTILDKLGTKTIHVKDASSLDKLFDSDFINSCVIIDTSRFFVNPTDWLPSLSKADFFICPPGYVMPMCHNVVEAMAVGAIPIINYPEWFNPTLRHMENCIVFDDKDDLVKNINDVLDMGKQQVAEMRRRTIDYYEKHLNPRNFVNHIESREGIKITVLMITDKNTRENAPRLDEKSILITGKPTISNNRWYKFLRAFRK